MDTLTTRHNYSMLKLHWQQGKLEDWQFIEAAWLQHREDDARREVAKENPQED